MERNTERQQLLSNMFNAHVQSGPGTVFSKLFLVALPIIQISMGCLYFKNCPRQTYIPIYMIVSGILGIFLALFSCLSCAKEVENAGYRALSYFCAVWNSLVTIFMFCWLISGSVWIYSIYTPNYNKTKAEELYCHKTLYLTAFWTTTLVYILLIGVIVGGFCFLFSTCCTTQGDDRHTNAA